MSDRESPLSPKAQDELYMPLVDDLRDIAHSGYGDPGKMKYHAWEGHIVPVREHNLEFRSAQLAGGIEGIPSQFITETSSDFHDYLIEKYLRSLNKGVQLAPT